MEELEIAIAQAGKDDIEIFKNKILERLEDLICNLPCISRGVGEILGESIAIRETVKTLSFKYETIVNLYEQQIKELKEKIEELEGGKDNE